MLLKNVLPFVFVIGTGAHLWDATSGRISVQRKEPFQIPHHFKKPHNFVNYIIQTLIKVRFVVPETGLNALQLIQYHGYPVEIHNATTEDGYILQIHRIPFGRNECRKTGKKKPVVFLMPGLVSTTAVYIINGPRNSLAFLLADLCYDVWIGNTRGTTFSRRHVTINPNLEPQKFFNFSINELGLYDLPTQIDHILTHTGRESLYYVGHSQGTTDFLIMAAEKPEYNKKIRLAVLLAPEAFCGNMPNKIFRILSAGRNLLSDLASALGAYEFLGHNYMYTLLVSILCNTYSPIKGLCARVTNYMGGYHREQFNYALLPVIASNLPGGSSANQWVHFGQFVNTGKFAYFDYGENNYFAYGQETPPDFKLHNVVCPVALYYGLRDDLSAPIDVQKLALQLPNVVVNKAVPDIDFTHMDFIWSKDLKKLVLDDVMKLLPKF